MGKTAVLSTHTLLLPLILAFMAGSGTDAEAQTGSDVLNQRLKSSLNTVVQEVHEAEAPAVKREILSRFLGKIERRARLADKLPFLSEENHAVLNTLQEKFGGYSAELRGNSGRGDIADGDLDAFASFVQQDLEQAEASWGNGGIYLSTGAIIIVLLIIILIA